MAVLTATGVRLMDLNGKTVRRAVSRILWDPIMAEKGGYKHFMLKEIFEQPRAIKDTMLGRVGMESGRIFLDEVDISEADFKVVSAGEDCGVRHQLARRRWRAKIMIERLARAAGGSGLWQRVPIPRSDYSAEYPDDSDFAIGRDGGYAGSAEREAKKKGSKTLAICNVVGSMITREVKLGL